MRRALRMIPTFTDEAEERAFWERANSADFFDWRKAERVSLPNLRPGATHPLERGGGIGALFDRRGK